MMMEPITVENQPEVLLQEEFKAMQNDNKLVKDVKWYKNAALHIHMGVKWNIANWSSALSIYMTNMGNLIDERLTSNQDRLASVEKTLKSPIGSLEGDDMYQSLISIRNRWNGMTVIDLNANQVLAADINKVLGILRDTYFKELRFKELNADAVSLGQQVSQLTDLDMRITAGNLSEAEMKKFIDENLDELKRKKQGMHFNVVLGHNAVDNEQYKITHYPEYAQVTSDINLLQSLFDAGKINTAELSTYVKQKLNLKRQKLDVANRSIASETSEHPQLKLIIPLLKAYNNLQAGDAAAYNSWIKDFFYAGLLKNTLNNMSERHRLIGEQDRLEEQIELDLKRNTRLSLLKLYLK